MLVSKKTMDYLLDTNVVVEHLRSETKGLGSYFSDLEIDRFGISAITLAELYRGCYKSNRVSSNVKTVQKLVSLPKMTVYEVDERVALEYGKLLTELESMGLVLDIADVFIAATARANGLTVLSKDKKHFTRLQNFKIKVKIIGE